MGSPGDDLVKPPDTGKKAGSSGLSGELTVATPPPGPGSRGSGAPSVGFGTTLDRFEILELLGAGGFGEVHRARDTRLGAAVTIYILCPTGSVGSKERRWKCVSWDSKRNVEGFLPALRACAYLFLPPPPFPPLPPPTFPFGRSGLRGVGARGLSRTDLPARLTCAPRAVWAAARSVGLAGRAATVLVAAVRVTGAERRQTCRLRDPRSRPSARGGRISPSSPRASAGANRVEGAWHTTPARGPKADPAARAAAPGIPAPGTIPGLALPTGRRASDFK